MVAIAAFDFIFSSILILISYDGVQYLQIWILGLYNYFMNIFKCKQNILSKYRMICITPLATDGSLKISRDSNNVCRYKTGRSPFCLHFTVLNLILNPISLLTEQTHCKYYPHPAEISVQLHIQRKQAPRLVHSPTAASS